VKHNQEEEEEEEEVGIAGWGHWAPVLMKIKLTISQNHG
jgi:U3 small nucleolar RNA-associated protein 14